MISLFSPVACQVSGPTLEPRSVTVVIDELIGAPSSIYVVLLGQSRRNA